MDMRPVTRRTLVACAPLLALVAAGCATPDNDRLSLGTSADPVVVLPAIEPGTPIADATGPSITSLDRSGWERIDFLVPNDATEHYPHFTRLQPRFDRGTARARGEYPTVETALEQEGSFGAILGESLAWPGFVANDGVMIIPRAIVPDQDSPMTHYERASEVVESTPAPASDTGTPAQAKPKAPKAKRSKRPKSIGPARW